MIVLSRVGEQTPSAETGKLLALRSYGGMSHTRATEALEVLTGRKAIVDNAKLANSGAGRESGFKGTKFKVAPHIDQTKAYESVFEKLKIWRLGRYLS